MAIGRGGAGFRRTDLEQTVVAEEEARAVRRWDRRAKHYDLIVDDAAG
jgi:hypothetical protein